MRYRLAYDLPPAEHDEAIALLDSRPRLMTLAAPAEVALVDNLIETSALSLAVVVSLEHEGQHHADRDDLHSRQHP